MLTASQSKTYQFIQQYIRKHSYSPTMAEIARGIGIKSRGVVHRYVHALAKQGLIQVLPNRKRNIQLLARTSSKWVLPLLGKIAAGKPIEAISDDQTIDVAEILLGSGRFALIVQGDSMIEEGIHSGDMVICKHADTADNGQIVVALVDNEQATLKQLRRNADNTVTLIPANTTMSPVTYPAEQVTIQGIFVALVRTTV